MAADGTVMTPAVTEIPPFEHPPPFDGWKDFEDKAMLWHSS